MLHDPEEVAARVLQVAATGSVTATDGTIVDVHAESVCVHGDSPGAVEMTRSIVARLNAEGIAVRSVL